MVNSLKEAIKYNRTRRFFPKSTWKKIQVEIGTESDGVPGKATANALARYQKRIALTPDGKFGPGTQKSFAELWATDKPLTTEESFILMEPTSIHESGRKGYAAHNRDGEFKGWWDKEGKPHKYSHKGRAPLHIGSSISRIQCSQVSGNAGRVLKRARYYAQLWDVMDEWDDAFDGCGDALLKVWDTPAGDWKIRIRGDIGRRAANTMPINGKDSWQHPWVDRLKRASEYDWFQKASDEVAYNRFFVPLINTIITTGFVDGGSIACLFDAAVNHGHGGMRRRLNKISPPKDNIFDFMRKFGTGKLARRRLKAHDKSQWWVSYTINRRP